jgi:hypothetical protein
MADGFISFAPSTVIIIQDNYFLSVQNALDPIGNGRLNGNINFINFGSRVNEIGSLEQMHDWQIRPKLFAKFIIL